MKFTSEKVNELLGVDEAFKVPNKLMSIMMNREERERLLAEKTAPKTPLVEVEREAVQSVDEQVKPSPVQQEVPKTLRKVKTLIVNVNVDEYKALIAFNNALNDELVVSRFEYIKAFKDFEKRIKDEKDAKETAQSKYDRQTELVNDVKAKNAVLEIDNQILLSGVKPDGYFKPTYHQIQLSDKFFQSISGKKYFERPAYTRKEVVDEIVKNGLDPKGVILVEVEVINAQH